MIRFAWLQTRTQTMITSLLLGGLGVAVVITGVQLTHFYTSLVGHCQTNCGQAIQQYLSHDNFMDKTLDLLSRGLPVLLGMFWGAPLVAREFESGTYRLAWTQSVSRSRWLTARLIIGAAATAVLAGLFSLAVTWWYHDRDRVSSNIYDLFDRRDITPVGYALFAFATGAMFGALLRRTVPAMAATLGLFIFARIAVDLWIRPHLLAATHTVVSLARQGPVQLGLESNNGGNVHLFAQGGGPPNSWVVASHFLNRTGQPVKSGEITAFLRQHCASLVPSAPPNAGPTKVPAGDPGALCLAKVSKTFKLAITYHPRSQYWSFQWIETAIFVLLAATATAATYWWITRRTD